MIRHAERFFLDVTDGAYQAVYSPLGSSEINVKDAAGNIRTPQQLSRGTREQLFLALRFGLILELGQRSERLPVIVDEALVNFDPTRGTKAAGSFIDLSETNQGAGLHLPPADRGLVHGRGGPAGYCGAGGCRTVDTQLRFVGSTTSLSLTTKIGKLRNANLPWASLMATFPSTLLPSVRIWVVVGSLFALRVNFGDEYSFFTLSG